MKLLLALFLLGLALVLPEPPLFRVHTSTRQVTCLTREAIGTTGGLRRPHQSQVEMPGRVIRAVSGRLVASEAGLFEDGRCLDGRPTWSLAQTPEGLVSGHNGGLVCFRGAGREVRCGSAPIHSLAWDEGRLLAASNQGLWSIDDSTVVAVRLSPNPVSATVTSMLAHPGGVLVGTAAGAYRRRGGDWAALPGGVVNVSAVAVGSDGRVWLGTADQGVFVEESGGMRKVAESPAHVSALLWTSEGLMVGSDQGAFLDGRPLYDWSGEICGNHITALACSHSQVWAGTFQDGLSQGSGGRWSEAAGLPSPWINQLSCEGDKVLVRLSSGAVVSGPGAWRSLGRSCGWPKDWTSGLGDGWVATQSGFSVRQAAGWKSFLPKPHLQGVVITAVARRGDQFWLGSQNGVYRVDPKSTRHYLAELPDSWVTCLETYQGQLWAGTFRGGLCRFDGKRWQRVSQAGTRIHCMLATPRGLWLGTPGGLLWTDGRDWKVFDCTKGLSSNAVWSLALQGDRLWVGTDSGLCETSQSQALSAGE